MAEFDYQWAQLPSKDILYNETRVKEFLDFTNIDHGFFDGKRSLDAGCGNGRYTYAMLELGAVVDSIDISEAAVKACLSVNPNARVANILDLDSGPYGFILSYGVLHHMPDPRAGFASLVGNLDKDGVIHIMVYGRRGQRAYTKLRKVFRSMDHEQRLSLVNDLAARRGGTAHGWWDALNPEYNYSYLPSDIVKWFDYFGLKNIFVNTKYTNVHINGTK